MQVFESYVQALGEDPAQYRKDTEQLEGWAKGLSSPSDLTPSADGSEIQKCLAGIAQTAKDGGSRRASLQARALLTGPGSEQCSNASRQASQGHRL